MHWNKELTSYEDDLRANSLVAVPRKVNLALDQLLPSFRRVVHSLDCGRVDDARLELPLVVALVGGVDAEAVGAVPVAVILVFGVEMAGDGELRRADLHVDVATREQDWNMRSLENLQNGFSSSHKINLSVMKSCSLEDLPTNVGV